MPRPIMRVYIFLNDDEDNPTNIIATALPLSSSSLFFCHQPGGSADLAFGRFSREFRNFGRIFVFWFIRWLSIRRLPKVSKNPSCISFQFSKNISVKLTTPWWKLHNFLIRPQNLISKIAPPFCSNKINRHFHCVRSGCEFSFTNYALMVEHENKHRLSDSVTRSAKGQFFPVSLCIVTWVYFFSIANFSTSNCSTYHKINSPDVFNGRPNFFGLFRATFITFLVPQNCGTMLPTFGLTLAHFFSNAFYLF